MTLADWVLKHPPLELLDPADPRINEFVRTTRMSGSGWDFELIKWPTPSAFFSRQNARVFYLASTDPSDGKITGLSSIALRTLRIGNRTMLAGILGDARISPGIPRDLKALFRGIYRDLLENAGKIEELRGAEEFLTAIFADNEASLLAFTRSRGRIQYERIGGLRTQGRLVLPWISNASWKLRGNPGAHEVSFLHYAPPLDRRGSRRDDALFDEESDLDLSDSERIVVRERKNGELLASAVFLPHANRRIELKKVPPLISTALKTLAVPRMLEPKWIAFPCFQDGLSSEKKREIYYDILSEALKTGRLSKWDLIMSREFAAPGRREWVYSAVSNVYRVRLAGASDSPAPGEVDLDPAFL